MDQQNFSKEIEKIMQYALDINVIDAMSSSQLRNLIIDPETQIKERLITSKNIIDTRSEMRKLAILKETEKYKNLILSISELKKNSEWAPRLEYLQIGRSMDGLHVLL